MIIQEIKTSLNGINTKLEHEEDRISDLEHKTSDLDAITKKNEKLTAKNEEILDPLNSQTSEQLVSKKMKNLIRTSKIYSMK